MSDFPARARTFVRAVRQMPNNVAAIRHDLDTRPHHQPESTASQVPHPADHTETHRLDELAHALATPQQTVSGLALATIADANQRRLLSIADNFANRLEQPVQHVLLAPGTGTTAQPDGVVVRTPSSLDWTRAVYVLVHASPTEHTVLLHPDATPRIDTLAEMFHALGDASLAVGTVISDQHDSRQLAESTTICLTRTQHIRELLTRSYRRTAMSTTLDRLAAQIEHTVHTHPRLAGTLHHQC